MNRFSHIIIQSLIVLLGFALCILFYFYSIGAFQSPAAVGYIHSPKELPYLDLDALKTTFSQESVPFYEADSSLSYAQAADYLIQQGAQVLIVNQDTDTIDSDLLQIANENGTTLLFVGRAPSDDALSSYDKAWYIGSSSALGGELLGYQLALAFRDGTIADSNGDHLLQYSFYLSNNGPYYQELASHTMEECEHYGVFSDQIQYVSENGEALEFTAEQLAGQPKPEALLCSTAQDARMLHDLAAQLGWLDSDAPVRIAAIAQNPTDAQALIADGICFAVSYYNPTAIAQTVADFALNSLMQEYAAQNIELQPDESGHFFVPFELITSLESQN